MADLMDEADLDATMTSNIDNAADSTDDATDEASDHDFLAAGAGLGAAAGIGSVSRNFANSNDDDADDAGESLLMDDSDEKPADGR